MMKQTYLELLLEEFEGNIKTTITDDGMMVQQEKNVNKS